MPSFKAALHPGLKIAQIVEIETRKRISSNVYLSRKSKQQRKACFEFGVCTPKIIINQKDPPLIRYICTDNVFSVSAKLRNGQLVITLPDRKEIADSFQRTQRVLHKDQ